MGVGSEVYTAIQTGRRGIGIELKTAYYNQAVKNMELAAIEAEEPDLFEALAEEN